MPAVSKEQAMDLLTKTVEKSLRTDDLLEIDNEIFPNNPFPEAEALQDSTPLIQKLVNHLRGRREIEEVVELWNLILPKHRNVWYNEEEERIHYNEEWEPLHAEHGRFHPDSFLKPADQGLRHRTHLRL